MDELILSVYSNLQKGVSVAEIYQAAQTKGRHSDDLFLAIKAGENLFNAKMEQERALFRERAWAWFNPLPAPSHSQLPGVVG